MQAAKTCRVTGQLCLPSCSDIFVGVLLPGEELYLTHAVFFVRLFSDSFFVCMLLHLLIAWTPPSDLGGLSISSYKLEIKTSTATFEDADFTELLSEKFCVVYHAFLLLPPFVMDGDAVDDGNKRKLIFAIMFCT